MEHGVYLLKVSFTGFIDSAHSLSKVFFSQQGEGFYTFIHEYACVEELLL